MIESFGLFKELGYRLSTYGGGWKWKPLRTMIVAQAHIEQCDPNQQAQNNRFVKEWVLRASYNAVQSQVLGHMWVTLLG